MSAHACAKISADGKNECSQEEKLPSFSAIHFLESMLYRQQIMNLTGQTLEVGCGGRRPGDDDVQAVFNVPQMRPKAFPKPAFDKVARNCIADFLADGKTDFKPIAFGIEHNQISSGTALPASVDVLKSTILLQPIVFLHDASFPSGSEDLRNRTDICPDEKEKPGHRQSRCGRAVSTMWIRSICMERVHPCQPDDKDSIRQSAACGRDDDGRPAHGGHSAWTYET